MLNMKSKIISATILMILVGSGCTTTQFITNPLHLPARPGLPTVPADSLSCIDTSTYTILVNRELMLKQYTEQLEVIIQSTWGDE